MEATDLIVLTPAGCLDPSPSIAACRAGARGTLDLQFTDDDNRAVAAIHRLAAFAGPRFGVKLGSNAKVLTQTNVKPAWAILPGNSVAEFPTLRSAGIEVLVEAVSLAEAIEATGQGADGIILKGHESGGRVGVDTAFVLIQKWRQHAERGRVALPFWVQGGIGPNTAAACLAAGAKGVVVDSQLFLARESPLGETLRKRIPSLDGSETAVLGAKLGEAYRIYSRADSSAAQELIKEEERLLAAELPAEKKLSAWREAVRSRVAADPTDGVWLLGQDIACAAGLAARGTTVAGIVQHICERARHNLDAARRTRHLSAKSPLAESHGTKYPILQGPMTRVSDTAAFADAVASGGALPFLALALLRQAETENLLAETRSLGKKPWGVGILGFVPAGAPHGTDSRPSASIAALRPHRRGPARPGQANWKTRGSPRTCTSPRRAC